MRVANLTVAVVAGVACACTTSAHAVWLGLDLPNTNVTIQIQLDGIDPETGDPAGTPFDVLVGTTQVIPLENGNIQFDDDGIELNNLDGGLFVESPWLIPTILGSSLSVTGGHLTIGPAPNGPYPTGVETVDLGGLSLVLDGGVNSVLFEFDFSADPVAFFIPLATDGTWDGTNFVIPTTVSDATIIELFGNPAYLIYTIGGQVAFTVPEPSSFALAGMGLIGLIPLLRRRRKARN